MVSIDVTASVGDAPVQTYHPTFATPSPSRSTSPRSRRSPAGGVQHRRDRGDRRGGALVGAMLVGVRRRFN